MGYEIPIIAAYTTFLLVACAAWVGGYLDPLQHSLQDVLLGKMGDNRASYGVKSMFLYRLLSVQLSFSSAWPFLGTIFMSCGSFGDAVVCIRRGLRFLSRGGVGLVWMMGVCVRLLA